MRPPTPADSGGSVLGTPVVSGSGGSAPEQRGRPPSGPAAGLLAAPVAEALAMIPGQSERLADAGISGGGCFVRPLPIDTTCAAAARRFFREAVSTLAIPSGLLHDGVTMASELAANTLHAQRNATRSAVRQRAAAGIPEIWLYLRGTGRTRELVCKVFDTERTWSVGCRSWHGQGPAGLGQRARPAGRGGTVGWPVGLSPHPIAAGELAGAWQGSLVRACGSRRPSLPDHVGRSRYSPEWLINELEAMVAERGLSSSIVRADMDGISVLSISQHLTVWRHGSTVSWRTPSGRYRQMDLADLVEVAEQIVCAHEEIALGEAVAV